MLLPFCPHPLGVRHELLGVLCHLLSPVWSGFYILTKNVQFSTPWSTLAICLTSPWLMFDFVLYLLHGFCSACFFYPMNFQWILYFLLLPLLVLSGCIVPQLSLPMSIPTCLWFHLFFLAVSSLIITVIISYFMPLINCSFSLLSFLILTFICLYSMVASPFFGIFISFSC